MAAAQPWRSPGDSPALGPGAMAVEPYGALPYAVGAGMGTGSSAGWAVAPTGPIGGEDLDMKVSALSRRTAAEMRKAEKERGDHARRLEVLEELCRQHLGSLDTRLNQARADAAGEVERAAQRMKTRMDRDLKQIVEAVETQISEVRAQQEQRDDAMKTLSRRVDAEHTSLEELKAWRSQAEARLQACSEVASSASAPPRQQLSSIAALMDGSSSQHGGSLALQEQFEAALSRDRKEAHERLRSSCAELTAHLNDLRRELVEQRRVSELASAEVQARHEALQKELAENFIDLESQIAELGGALASRLQAKLQDIQQDVRKQCAAMVERMATLEKSTSGFEGKVHFVRQENAELRGDIAALKDPSGRGLVSAMEAAVDEAKTVHYEVMSLDTRVAAIEERLADDPSRRRFESLPPKGSLAAPLAAPLSSPAGSWR